MKRRFVVILAGLCVLGATSNAFAQEGKLKLGLRLGYALPAGHVYGAQVVDGVSIGSPKLSDGATGQVPIWLDVGYQVIPNLMLGVYGQYGFVGTQNQCEDCSAQDVRVGIQGQYHFLPMQLVDPWLGVGIGYEYLRTRVGDRSGSLSGWELLNLQGGVDFRALSQLSVGPFVSVSLDEFTKASGVEQYAEFPGKTLHEWITFGVKGTFGI